MRYAIYLFGKLIDKYANLAEADNVWYRLCCQHGTDNVSLRELV